MTKVWNGFLFFLASATDRGPARTVEFLRAENRILRSKLPSRIEVTASERRLLLKLGAKLGTKIRDVISIVSLRTFHRWVAAAREGRSTERSSRGGRPKTALETRALVIRMANENGWGLGRIIGELKRLGISLSKPTVKSILREHGFDLGPKRGQGTWSEFIERHAKTLWACDFFQKKIWTTQGFVDCFALFFIHVGTRRVHLAGTTCNPTHAWVVQQSRNVAAIFQDEMDKPEYMIRDNDAKFSARFDATFESEQVQVVRTCIRAPNMNAHIERWIQSLQVECLDQFVVFGEDHFRHLVAEYVDYYNSKRPHQSRENLPLDGQVLERPQGDGAVECEERLGGVLKSYSWQKAA